MTFSNTSIYYLHSKRRQVDATTTDWNLWSQKVSIIILQLSAPVSCFSSISTLPCFAVSSGKNFTLNRPWITCLRSIFIKNFSALPVFSRLRGRDGAVHRLVDSMRNCKWTCWINKLKNVIKYLRAGCISTGPHPPPSSQQQGEPQPKIREQWELGDDRNQSI